MNDFADREFDPHVRRTAGPDRFARQAVSPAEALGLFAVLAADCTGAGDPAEPPDAGAALIGGVLAVTYPFLKRFFSLPQAYLGLAFSWSVPMAFSAQTGELPLLAWVAVRLGRAVDHRLRHDVRNGGPRGRPRHRHPLVGDPVRPRRPAGHRGPAGGRARGPLGWSAGCPASVTGTGPASPGPRRWRCTSRSLIKDREPAACFPRLP